MTTNGGFLPRTNGWGGGFLPRSWILEKLHMTTEKVIFNLCEKESKKSKCHKIHFGAIIISEDGKIIGKGYNIPLGGCEHHCLREVYKIKSSTHVEVCSALHAEQMALLNALLTHSNLLPYSTMYLLGVTPDGKRPQLNNTCSICSRMIAYCGIGKVILWNEQKPVILTRYENLALSLKEAEKNYAELTKDIKYIGKWERLKVEKNE